MEKYPIISLSNFIFTGGTIILFWIVLQNETIFFFYIHIFVVTYMSCQILSLLSCFLFFCIIKHTALIVLGMDMYEVREIVGKGAFAKVYSATCMISSCNTDVLDFDYLDADDEVESSKLVALKVNRAILLQLLYSGGSKLVFFWIYLQSNSLLYTSVSFYNDVL